MRTMLVTGGAGFIGSNFIKYIQDKYPLYKVINLDKLTYAGNLRNLGEASTNENYQFVRGDICDKELVNTIFTNNEIDFVINFAAESHVDKSIADAEQFVVTNVLGTQNLLNISKAFWLVNGGYKEEKKFLQVSTDEVYGSLGKTGMFTESSPLEPHSPYSASKAAADLLVKAYYDTYGLPINITRCSNNYGPNQYPEKLIPLMISNALKKKPLPVYGDGMNIRDWLFVEDHCRALDIVLHKAKSGEIFNIGGNNERTNIQIVSTIIDYLNRNVDNQINGDLIAFVEDRKGHDRRYAIDAGKIKAELGWQPKMSFDEGIRKTVRWYLDNRGWLDGSDQG